MKKQPLSIFTRRRFFLALLFLSLFLPLSSPAETELPDEPTEIRIGVLALRGKEICLDQWNATAQYLTRKIPGHTFTIVPLDFDEIGRAVEKKQVHFTITNSSMYVSLEAHFGNTRIATMKTDTLGMGLTKFGGVLFCRSDRDDIQSINDLKGQRFMAVDNKSFGGWHMAWRHLLDHGIEPDRDFKSFTTGGTHDAVVMAVLNKTVDAGTVRTSTLEQMAMEGKITLHQFRVLDDKIGTSSDFNLMHTTVLYPEWPFAKLSHTDEELARDVVVALLQLQPTDKAARVANMMGWTIPLDYQSVHDCLKKIKFDPYDVEEEMTFQQLLHGYWPWFSGALLLLVLICGGSLYFIALNRRLRMTMTVLDHELAQRSRIEKNLNEFKVTLDQIMDCVFMFLPDSLRFIYINQGGIQQIGYTMEELFTMTPIDLKPEFTEDSFRTLIKPLLDGTRKSLTFTTIHQAKNGNRFPVEIFLQYVQPTGDTGRFVAIVRDITQRLTEAKEREKLQSQLLHTQKLESVGQLAAGIAHEINTPTQYIGTNIDFLEDGFKELATLMTAYQRLLTAEKDHTVTAELLQEVDEIQENTDWEYLAQELPLAISQSKDGVHRISTIVRAMKEFSHPGSKEKAPLAINDLIKTTLTISHSEWKYVADVETDLADNLPQISCLSDEMGQVFLNLLINAAHAIASWLGENPKGEKGRITISTRSLESQVEIRLTDTGCGIPGEILERIFDPFFTTKEVGKGTGQGLAIARDVIVNKHGGTLEVESKEGHGATFIIRLPIKPA
ncbi:MAG: PAS domain [Desulfobulbaceae bacterium]|nr:MAG: PAS domain [Desulfobulbaceae bacterium]